MITSITLFRLFFHSVVVALLESAMAIHMNRVLVCFLLVPSPSFCVLPCYCNIVPLSLAD